jgi:hypothetical protein
MPRTSWPRCARTPPRLSRVTRQAVGPPAVAAPGPVGRRLRHRPGHRVLRRGARPHHCRGEWCRHLLHPIQAPPQRRLHHRGLHQHALRDHGRRRDLGRRLRAPGDRPRRDDLRRQDHPGASRVQRRLRLCPGRHDSTGSSSTTRRPSRRSASPTTCGPARTSGRPAAPTRSAPSRRFRGCSRASTTVAPTKGPLLGRPRCSVSRSPRSAVGPRRCRRPRLHPHPPAESAAKKGASK